MGHKFAEIAFTDTVRKLQTAGGSRGGYQVMDQGKDYNHVLGPREINFIGARDSFYMASVSETTWPYLQHRGGPAGFIRVLDANTLGFADFRGNRQYVSVGNLKKDNRVALFFMDYPNQSRLKLLGRVTLTEPEEPDTLGKLEVDDYRARVERGFLIHVEAFDWNCPQHITPRFTQQQIEERVQSLREEMDTLKQRQTATENTSEAIGDGPLRLEISGIRQLTPTIRAYELRAPEGQDLPPAPAGSHLQIPVRFKDGHSEIRHYSIFQDPIGRDSYEIAVSREPHGAGGSERIHETFSLGSKLRCGKPVNQFPLHENSRPAVLIAGGIGITPIRAMAHTLKIRGTPMHLHYAGRSLNEMAYQAGLARELNDQITVYSKAEGQRMDLQTILRDAPGNAFYYVCGPSRLIDDVIDSARRLNIDVDRIRFERFSAVPDSESKPISVQLKRSGKHLRVKADQNILDAALAAGVDAPFSCKAGVCKTCAVTVIDGKPDHRDSALSSAEREESGLMCPCVSLAQGDHLVLDL